MKIFLRCWVLVLFLSLCLSILPQTGTVWAAPSDKTVIIAGSDFQSYETDPHNACKNQVNDIFAQIRKDYTDADGFLFAGDYYHLYENEQSENGMDTLVNCILDSGMGIAPENIVLAQGNHDQVGTRGFSPSGNNDPANGKYGVFLINEDDFMWFAGNSSQNGSERVDQHEQTVKNTAANLEKYLNEKVEKGYREPIFVVSHLPLHYSMRTWVYGDGRYAQYIIDVLNDGAAQGLNIVYLFGHNHSHNWDNHLGGSAIYLERGDTINVSHPSNPRDCYEDTLGFTYLNAGYVGYFTTDNNEPVDRTLTMTVYEFGNGQLTIKRYSQEGLHNLKSAGTENNNRYNGRNTEASVDLFSRDTRVFGPEGVSFSLVKEVKEPESPTCQKKGTAGYFITYDGKCYGDLGLTEITTPADQILSQTAHKYRYTDNQNGTHDGVCDYCNHTLKALPHNYYSRSCENCSAHRTLEKVPAQSPTCTKEGNVPYYYHAETDTYYEDIRAYFPLTREETVLAKTPHTFSGKHQSNAEGHWQVCSCGTKQEISSHVYENGLCRSCGYQKPVTLTKIPAKDSTCTQAGNREYYKDAESGKYYTDAKGTKVTTPKEQALPLADHRYREGRCELCLTQDVNYTPPTSAAPSTAAPTVKPTTKPTPKPTAKPTVAPSTAAPSTAAPSTAAPSTATPSTAAPSTAAPSTASPTTASAPASTAALTSLPSQAPATTGSVAPSSVSNAPAASSTTPCDAPGVLPYVIVGIVVIAGVALTVFLLLKKKGKN